MQIFFESLDLWDVIDGDLKEPNEGNREYAKLQKEFKKKYIMALRYIL